MKKFINIIAKIVDIILTLIIIIGLAFAFFYVIKIVPFVVLSGSMEPNLHVGSLSFINKNYDYEDVKKGDIIAFKKDSGVLVAHSVYAIENNEFITKGNANEETDVSYVTKPNYIGRNVFNIPYAGYSVKWIQTKKGKIISGTLIACLIVSAFFFGDNGKEKKKTKRKKKDNLKDNIKEEIIDNIKE